MAKKRCAGSRDNNIIEGENGFLTIFTLLLLVFLVSIVGIKASGEVWRLRQAQILRDNIQLEALIYSGIMMEELFIEYFSYHPDHHKVSIPGKYPVLGYSYENTLLNLLNEGDNDEDYKMFIAAEDLKNEKRSEHSYYTD